jgi:hypothetical protein
MAVYAVNYTLEKGTDFETEINLTEDDGSPLNLVGYIGSAKIRKYPTSPRYKAFTITFINREQGRIKISLSSTQTSGLEGGRNYYDMFLTDSNGKIRKVIEGNIIVNESATLGATDSDNLDGLGNIDITNVQDGYVLMYDAETQKYRFVDPDKVLSKAVEDNFLPDDFLDKLDIDLDDRIDIDSGDFVDSGEF